MKSVNFICRPFHSYCLHQTTTPFYTYYIFREHMRYDNHYLQITHCRDVTAIMEHTEYIPWNIQPKLLIHLLWSCLAGCNAIVLLELMAVKLSWKILVKVRQYLTTTKTQQSTHCVNLPLDALWIRHFKYTRLYFAESRCNVLAPARIFRVRYSQNSFNKNMLNITTCLLEFNVNTNKNILLIYNEL